jgi:hypothetical protein
MQPDITAAAMTERYPELHPIFIGPTMGVYVWQATDAYGTR